MKGYDEQEQQEQNQLKGDKSKYYWDCLIQYFSRYCYDIFIMDWKKKLKVVFRYNTNSSSSYSNSQQQKKQLPKGQTVEKVENRNVINEYPSGFPKTYYEGMSNNYDLTSNQGQDSKDPFMQEIYSSTRPPQNKERKSWKQQIQKMRNENRKYQQQKEQQQKEQQMQKDENTRKKIQNLETKQQQNERKINQLEQKLRKYDEMLFCSQNLEKQIKLLKRDYEKIFFPYLKSLILMTFNAYGQLKSGLIQPAVKPLSTADNIAYYCVLISNALSNVPGPLGTVSSIITKISTKYLTQKIELYIQKIGSMKNNSVFQTEWKMDVFLTFFIQKLIKNEYFKKELRLAVKHKKQSLVFPIIPVIKQFASDINKSVFGVETKQLSEIQQIATAYMIKFFITLAEEIDEQKFIENAKQSQKCSRMFLGIISPKAAAYDYYEAEQYWNAIQCYQKAIKEDPQDNQAYLGYCTALMYHDPESKKNITQLLKLEKRLKNDNQKHPMLADVYNLKGLQLINLKKQGEAVQEFLKSLVLRPKAQTHTNIGIAYKRLGKYKNSMDSFHTAIKLDHKCRQAYDNLQQLLSGPGKQLIKQSVGFIQQVHNKHPDNKQAQKLFEQLIKMLEQGSINNFKPKQGAPLKLI